ncbi:PTS glucose transporter subunit IIA [Rhodococcus sp. 05-2256-B2]|uniref:PTS sugar transporter subunit IIA n=1 Tax=Nocardiaceae TaxID=85025 RepID=UPI00050CC0CA|nr:MULTISPECIES: PTS glucose transporter subunit IIA [Rhodococcus]OZD87847.1 PTS glucose transporter subunit IIA [Rhodococcus sp. 05-2256-B4]OZD93199.1 PTS glucose transporter subunit IIA [Rhodococcus sp. 05-2256-B3]OZD97952.1 PTS glucose transporter subunit IIA [Rhodococcus sp. 05-2256-B1]OZD99207.1 PTS glucose transporter subunit IIA [Rhodococcus sp. 05-2256-B2]
MSGTSTIFSPVAGQVISLADVPDPVFSSQMVGSGVAVRPAAGSGPVEVRSPIAGQILKLHPHAFVVFTDDKAGVLVHIGIDTVKMKGQGFELVAAEGDRVQSGDLVITYDPAAIAEAGYSDVIPVVLMDSEPDAVTSAAVGTSVAQGDSLFVLP